ncbi:MAG TPA: hypothetical protein VEO91_14625 [Candidatus Limnocylindria bacterium]|nr:hypothetical protein [Candidatus Limnocylindria bacterium]
MDSNTEPTPVPGKPPQAQATTAPNAAAPASATEPAPTVVPARPARRDPLPIVLALAALVAVGGVSFAVGRVSAPQAAARTGLSGAAGFPGTGQRGDQGNGQGLPGNGQGNGFGNLGRALGGLAIRGTVTAVAADHITIRLDSGQTVDIPTGTDTTYHRQAAATATDVAAGTAVIVQLQPNAAGGAGQVAPNASNPPGGLGRFIGTARDITIVAQ